MNGWYELVVTGRGGHNPRTVDRAPNLAVAQRRAQGLASGSGGYLPPREEDTRIDVAIYCDGEMVAKVYATRHLKKAA